MNCLECGKMITQIEGRRPRLYCSGNCRQKAWQKKQKGCKVAIKDLTKNTNEFKAPEYPKSNYTIDSTTHKENIIDKGNTKILSTLEQWVKSNEPKSFQEYLSKASIIPIDLKKSLWNKVINDKKITPAQRRIIFDKLPKEYS